MRIVFVVGLALAACTGGCGPKPSRVMSSKDCLAWQCPPAGDCVCVDKK